MAALDILGPGESSYTSGDFNGVEEDDAWPSGCYFCSGAADCDGIWFNAAATGASNGGAAPICARGLEPLAPGRVLYLGDSDVDYWPNTRSVSPGSYNVAIGGAMCSEVVGYLNARLEAFSPSTMVLVCGENDIADGFSAAEAFDNFQEIVTAVTAAGIRVVSMGTKNEPGTRELHAAYAEFDALCLNLASSLDDFTFVDVNAGFMAMGNPASLYSDDDLHMTAAGYAHWDAWVTDALADSSCAIWRSGVCVSTA